VEPEPADHPRPGERRRQTHPRLHPLHPLRARHQGRLTPASDDSGTARRSSLTVVGRLIRFARPYLAWIALGLACAGLYTGARNLQAYLLKPLVNEVLVPEQAGVRAVPASRLSRWFGAYTREEKIETKVGKPAAEAAPVDEKARRARLDRGVRDSLWRVAAVFGVLLFVIPLAEFGKSYGMEYVLGRVLVDIQNALCSKLLSLPLRFHHDTTRGDTLSRTLNDVSRAHRALDLIFADLVQAALSLVIGAAVLFSISWQLTLLSMLVVPPLVIIVSVFGKRIRRTARRRQERVSGVTQRLFEILAGIKLIKAFRAEKAEEGSFARENGRLFRTSMRVVKNRVLAKSLTELLNNAVVVGMLVAGSLLLLRDLWGLTVGDLAAFLGVMFLTYGPTKTLSKGWTDLMDAAPAAERFFELLDAREEVPDLPDAVRITGVHDGIRISKLAFSYGREPVLHDFSLDVKAGEVVAIVGRTGAGKSTLADLLLRFYDPDEGSIEIDGVDLRRIARDSLLDHVAVVTQEPFLFAGSIRDNIRYGRRDATEEEILEAARVAHVDEFTRSLPDGYDTEVGETGVKLSGGQRQRVTIARAILKNPAILIFDEATSSLDAKSERYVQEAIDALLGGRTVFVIAHRLSTIRNADKIVVLEGGSVSRVGTHDQLMASDNLYRELISLSNRTD
jgi:subfamily B ATP-binding cassette protein MsbA